MNAIALRMFDADLLQATQEARTLIWVLCSVGPRDRPVTVRHSALLQPGQVRARRRHRRIQHGLRLLCLFFGPLAAVLVGVEAAPGTPPPGVFRDLVVTGRSRLALFAAASRRRWRCAGGDDIGYGLVLIGSFAFASILPDPDSALVLNGPASRCLLRRGVCGGVGFASLTASNRQRSRR